MRQKSIGLIDGRQTLFDADNFSYVEIAEGERVVVPQGQEMVHRRDVMVRGDLMVYGDTCQIGDASEQGLFWTTIPSTASVRVPVNRLMLYVSPLIVRGNLMVNGLLKEV